MCSRARPGEPQAEDAVPSETLPLSPIIDAMSPDDQAGLRGQARARSLPPLRCGLRAREGRAGEPGPSVGRRGAGKVRAPEATHEDAN